MEQIHLCADMLGTEEMTSLAIPVLQTAEGSLPQPMACPGQLNPIAIPTAPHTRSQHHTARWHLGTVPAPSAATRELVLQELEMQAQLVPWDGQGEADLLQTPGRTLQSRTRCYGQGITLAASSLLWAPLGAKAWAEPRCGRKGKHFCVTHGCTLLAPKRVFF